MGFSSFLPKPTAAPAAPPPVRSASSGFSAFLRNRTLPHPEPVASVREQDRVRSREVARDTGDAFGPPVVPSSVIHAQGSLWGWVNGYALDPDLQDALAVWWYAHPHDGMDEVWRKIRTKEISDKDLRSTLEREVGSMGGTNMVWAVSPDGRRVAVNLSVSARGITVDVGTGTKRRTLSPARVVRVTREVLALPG